MLYFTGSYYHKIKFDYTTKNLNHVIFSNHELPLGEEYESHLSSQSDPRKQNKQSLCLNTAENSNT